MLFSSPDFLFGFLPVFLAVYFISPMRLKNLVLMLASLFFYFTTSGQLTVILILSIVVNHLIAQRMHAAGAGAAKAWLGLGLALNLAPLLYYKYARFFLSSLQAAADAAGLHLPMPDLHPILPIGISFFTFQAISYIADVYMRRVAPARSLVDFGMYHACFPQLIAGPIVRYEEIEKQVHSRTHTLDDVYNGSVQFCFGLAKKVALADPAGIVADKAFGLPHDQLTLGSAWLGIAAYTLQIYFDFSGYSDMAIGLGRILGFPYPENFDQPYRARSITEFWRRWHMTLSRWFRDYVYIPLGGNRGGEFTTYRNLFIVFGLCALWHGAAYTFLVWGLGHGILIALERAGWLNSARLRLGSLPVFVLATILWVPFRADSLAQTGHFLRAMSGVDAATPWWQDTNRTLADPKVLFLLALASLICLCGDRAFYRLRGMSFRRPLLVAGYSAVLYVLAAISVVEHGFNPFIYFQF
jgi:alginate O-acetyltransferase complex protein AlgI